MIRKLVLALALAATVAACSANNLSQVAALSHPHTDTAADGGLNVGAPGTSDLDIGGGN
jgi:hypothetical protein